MKEAEDIAIQRVREVRHRISAEFDHDPQKLVEHYREVEKQYADRLKHLPPQERQPTDIPVP